MTHRSSLAALVLALVSSHGCEPGPQPPEAPPADAHAAHHGAAGGHAGEEDGHAGLGGTMRRVQLLSSDLWFAGEAGNAALAGYLVHELEESLEEVGADHPSHDGVALTPYIGAMLGEDGALHGVEAALEAGDEAAFAAAYDQVVSTCNACHQGTGHPYLVIQRPTAPARTNLRFTPQK